MKQRKGWRMNSDVGTHSPSFPSLHLRHRSFYNPSVALPTSQLILQHFRCFIYVSVHSRTLLSLLLRHRFFTYVTWRAAHGDSRARVHKSRYLGEMLLSSIHWCDVTKSPYLLSDELCTSPLHCNRLFVYTVGAAVSASLCSEHVILT